MSQLFQKRRHCNRVCLLATFLAIAPAATAYASNSDGVYGRFDGDLELRTGAGVALSTGGANLSAHAGALYLSTAGLYAHYIDSLAANANPVARSIAVGIHLQPLFLARFGNNLEMGPPRLDLFVDSVAIQLGAFWHASQEFALNPQPGLEFSVGLAFPFFANATGLFLELRGALRWRAVDLAGHGDGNLIEKGALLSATLAWHHVLLSHIVDAGDGLKR